MWTLTRLPLKCGEPPLAAYMRTQRVTLDIYPGCSCGRPNLPLPLRLWRASNRQELRLGITKYRQSSCDAGTQLHKQYARLTRSAALSVSSNHVRRSSQAGLQSVRPVDPISRGSNSRSIPKPKGWWGRMIRPAVGRLSFLHTRQLCFYDSCVRLGNGGHHLRPLISFPAPGDDVLLRPASSPCAAAFFLSLSSNRYLRQVINLTVRGLTPPSSEAFSIR